MLPLSELNGIVDLRARHAVLALPDLSDGAPRKSKHQLLDIFHS